MGTQKEFRYEKFPTAFVVRKISFFFVFGNVSNRFSMDSLPFEFFSLLINEILVDIRTKIFWPNSNKSSLIFKK